MPNIVFYYYLCWLLILAPILTCPSITHTIIYTLVSSHMLCELTYWLCVCVCIKLINNDASSNNLAHFSFIILPLTPKPWLCTNNFYVHVNLVAIWSKASKIKRNLSEQIALTTEKLDIWSAFLSCLKSHRSNTHYLYTQWSTSLIATTYNIQINIVVQSSHTYVHTYIHPLPIANSSTCKCKKGKKYRLWFGTCEMLCSIHANSNNNEPNSYPTKSKWSSFIDDDNNNKRVKRIIVSQLIIGYNTPKEEGNIQKERVFQVLINQGSGCMFWHSSRIDWKRMEERYRSP